MQANFEGGIQFEMKAQTKVKTRKHFNLNVRDILKIATNNRLVWSLLF